MRGIGSGWARAHIAHMKAALPVILVAVGCASDPLPTCAEMGCRYSPSGSPDRFSMCQTDECWCSFGHVDKLGYVSDGWAACSQPKCSPAGTCPTGSTARLEQYSMDGVTQSPICFCDPDDQAVTVAE